MTRDVKISICGMQKGPNVDGDSIQTVVTGEYFVKNEKQYVLYEEYIEDEVRPIKNRLKLMGDKLEITKSGPLSTQMLFEKGQKNMSQYMTPYGSLVMGIDTKEMSVVQNESQIDIGIKYALDMNEEFVADCEITICIQEL